MAEKKKPKPGPSTGGSSTSRIKKPKGSQPLTLGTGGLRTSKISKKQMAGTRKVVGAIAAVTPVGRAAKGVGKVAKRLNNPPNRAPFLGSRTEEFRHAAKIKIMNKTGGTYTNPIRGAKAKPKSDGPWNTRSLPTKNKKILRTNKPKPAAPKRQPRLSSNKDLRPLPQRGKRVTPAENKKRAADIAFDKAERRYDSSVESMATGYKGGMYINPRGLKGKNLKKSNKIRKIAGWDK